MSGNMIPTVTGDILYGDSREGDWVIFEHPSDALQTPKSRFRPPFKRPSDPLRTALRRLQTHTPLLRRGDGWLPLGEGSRHPVPLVISPQWLPRRRVCSEGSRSVSLYWGVAGVLPCEGEAPGGALSLGFPEFCGNLRETDLFRGH